MPAVFPDDIYRRLRALENQTGSGQAVPFYFPTATDAQLLIYNGTAWVPVSMSGDATMNDLGVVTVTAGSGSAIYGDGSDGSVTFDGASTIVGASLSGGNYTLTRDVFYDSIVINSGVSVNVVGCRVFAKSSLTLHSGAVLHCNGNAASGSSGGSGSSSIGITFSGGNGGTGGVVSSNGASGTSMSSTGVGALGGQGGSGGSSGAGQTGGSGGALKALTVAQGGYREYRVVSTSYNAGSTGAFTPGSGGGGGGGSTSPAVGGGGGGGAGFLIVVAHTIVNNGTMSANGGAGADASGGGNCGGGGGGGGGVAFIISNSFTGNAAVATGGAGGAKLGTGSVGSSGSNGLVVTLSNSAGSGGSSGFSAGGDLAGTSTYQTIEEAYTTQSQASAATIDFGTARVHRLTLTGNVTITLAGPASSRACGLTLYLIQDGTGSRTVTWPGSVKWPSGTAPTLSTAASSVDIVVLESTDGGTTWYGNLAGKGYA